MTKTAEQIIATPVEAYRSTPTTSDRMRIDRRGGKFGAGLIRRASLITRGEALGHGAWIDATFLDQVAAAKRTDGTFGYKVRFTHPSLSSDGLGRAMGRVTNLRREGDQVYGDVHFTKASHKTPDGDLSGYVMDLAEEDPQAFAMSIVFYADQGAMQRHQGEHGDADGRFVSPDADNAGNLPHVRLDEFKGADFVDTPAANPGGLFHRGHEIPEEADRLFEYAFGLTDEKPELVQLSADVDRVTAYANRFLESHQLAIVRKDETEMSKDNQKPDGDQAPKFATVEQFESLDSKLDKLAESVTALAAAPKAQELSTEPAELEPVVDRKAEAKRVADLYALAETSGISKWQEQAAKWAEGGLSLEQAKVALFDRLQASNGLTKDAGEQPGDPDAKFKAEYREGQKDFEAMEVTEEEYILSRKLDTAA